MSYTILIVDDSDTVREVLCRTIKMTGLPIDQILQASNGKKALQQLKEKWVDLIFSDIHMPEMTGLELLDEITNDAGLKQIPLIIISTEGSATRITELKKKGIRGYIRKPFTPEKIRDIIIQTLGEWE